MLPKLDKLFITTPTSSSSLPSCPASYSTITKSNSESPSIPIQHPVLLQPIARAHSDREWVLPPYPCIYPFFRLFPFCRISPFLNVSRLLYFHFRRLFFTISPPPSDAMSFAMLHNLHHITSFDLDEFPISFLPSPLMEAEVHDRMHIFWTTFRLDWTRNIYSGLDLAVPDYMH
jgi:hypothetical protein